MRGRAPRGPLRSAQLRRRTRRVPGDAGCARQGDLRAHGGVRVARAASARAPARARSRPRKPAGDGRLRPGRRRDAVARGVLLGGERGSDHGRRPGVTPAQASRGGW